MSTVETNEPRAIPPEFRDDTEAVMEHLTAGKPLAPDVAQRIRERGERIREEVFRKHGILDIGSPAIRELRDA
jgi:hypothetical protein